MARKSKQPAKKINDKKQGARPGLLGVALRVAVIGVLLWAGYWFFMPDIVQLRRGGDPGPTAFMQKVIDEDGGIRHRYVPLSQISPNLVQAVLIAEDDAFYSHGGFDFRMLQKAVERNLEAGGIRYGASTLSQQLAKNLYLSSDRSLLRKIAEALVTLRLEIGLEKPRILEIYLNSVEWGRNVFGAEAAARHWFGVSASNLSPVQAARLAACLPSPAHSNPAKPSASLKRRARSILNTMRQRGYGNVWK